MLLENQIHSVPENSVELKKNKDIKTHSKDATSAIEKIHSILGRSFVKKKHLTSQTQAHLGDSNSNQTHNTEKQKLVESLTSEASPLALQGKKG